MDHRDQHRDAERYRYRDRDPDREFSEFGGHDSGGAGRPRPGDRQRSNRPSINEQPPQLYSIHRGTVVSVQEYGVFVKLENFERHGLVHISQISSTKLSGKPDIEQMLLPNEHVFCKVISVGDDRKISLSMKYVGQTEGNDLDKNNVNLEMEQTRRRAAPDDVDRTIHLGAVLKTTCSRCNGQGHTKLECYAPVAAGTLQYELVSDGEDDAAHIPMKPDVKRPLETHALDKRVKKHKHDKKEKKDKKVKKDKKDKKHKKHKKHQK